MDEPVKVKLCGITHREDALCAARLGADYLGLVFAESPRRVTLDRARGILEGFPYPAAWVGVFKDEPLKEVERIARALKLRWVQLHGREDLNYVQTLAKEFRVIKGFEFGEETSLEFLEGYPLEWVLLDRTEDANRGWDFLKASRLMDFKKVFLAGRLNSETVAGVLRQVKPYAVDVSRGIEASVGRKDPRKIKAFIRAVKGHPGEEKRKRDDKMKSLLSIISVS